MNVQVNLPISRVLLPVNSERAALFDEIRGAVIVLVDEDGTEHDHALPAGSKEVRVQNRMCGDWYCFIGGKRQVSAIGNSREVAFSNALANARRAA